MAQAKANTAVISFTQMEGPSVAFDGIIFYLILIIASIFLLVTAFRRNPLPYSGPLISATCPDCEAVMEFPAHLSGSTQSCIKCYAFFDIPKNGETDDHEESIEEWGGDEPASS